MTLSFGDVASIAVAVNAFVGLAWKQIAAARARSEAKQADMHKENKDSLARQWTLLEQISADQHSFDTRLAVVETKVGIR